MKSQFDLWNKTETENFSEPKFSDHVKLEHVNKAHQVST